MMLKIDLGENPAIGLIEPEDLLGPDNTRPQRFSVGFNTGY
jgi:hypothetical protein